MKTVRIWFQKTGAARFISHLDLAHCMARALHRARVPLWYTQGYNPRPHMVFALPLPLGVTGLRECVDIKIDEEAITEEELARRLSEALPATLPVLAVTEPQEKPGKITWASYTLLLEPEEGTAEELLEKFRALLAMPEIPMEKHTKSGMALIDLRPFLNETEAFGEEGALRLEAFLPAGSEKNITPFLLTEALQKHQGARFFARVSRTNLYDGERKIFA